MSKPVRKMSYELKAAGPGVAPVWRTISVSGERLSFPQLNEFLRDKNELSRVRCDSPVGDDCILDVNDGRVYRA